MASTSYCGLPLYFWSMEVFWKGIREGKILVIAVVFCLLVVHLCIFIFSKHCVAHFYVFDLEGRDLWCILPSCLESSIHFDSVAGKTFLLPETSVARMIFLRNGLNGSPIPTEWSTNSLTWQTNLVASKHSMSMTDHSLPSLYVPITADYLLSSHNCLII